MSHLNWSPRYSVKVKRFDDDHQQLFTIINQMHEQMRMRPDDAQLHEALLELLRSSERHFAGEEAEMKRRGYPQLQAHHQQHCGFRGVLRDFCEQHRAHKAAVSAEMLEFLSWWLATHITGTDQQYSAFLNARGVQ